VFTPYIKITSSPSDEICSSSGRTDTLIVGKRRSGICDKNFIWQNVLTTADGTVLHVACFTRRTLNNRTPSTNFLRQYYWWRQRWVDNWQRLSVTFTTYNISHVCYTMNATHNTPIPGIDKLVPLCKFVKNDRPRLGAVINAINVLSRYDNTACSSQH
jgi:hypothetical protein